MVWSSFSDFLHMGGYGLYVWGSVIVTFGLMIIEVVILALRRRAILEHLGRMGEADRLGGDDDEGKA
jgi:heme exporter protein D